MVGKWNNNLLKFTRRCMMLALVLSIIALVIALISLDVTIYDWKSYQ